MTKDVSVSVTRMADLLNALHQFSKVLDTTISPANIDVRALPATQNPNVHIFGAPHFVLDATTANAVFTQLVSNAFDHGATRGDILTTPKSILVCDDGAGVESQDMSRVFEPFFTTKRDRGGIGMGLPIAAKLLEHGGLTVDLWQKNGGAVFEIHL